MKKKVRTNDAEGGNRAFVVLTSLVFALAAVSVFFGSYTGLWNMITGQATTATTTASVTINSPPVINFTMPVNKTGEGVMTISAGTFQQLNFTFHAYDADGRSNIDNSTARLSINITTRASDGDLYFTNESRFNTTCQANGTLQAVDVITFLCSVYVWYWDAAGDWTINATIRDIESISAENSTLQFKLAQTTAMVMAPTALTWPTLELGNQNRTSNNDPIIVNNTGNKNIGLAGFTITGYDLQRTSSGTYPESVIKVQNFSVRHFNATAAADCNSGAGVNCYECNGTMLLNDTAGSTNPQPLPFANMTAGNNSLALRNGTSGQEEMFFCLRLVPSQLARTTYDTAGDTGTPKVWTAPWIVEVS